MSVREVGPVSRWCGGKVLDYVMENGMEVQFCFTDGTSATFDWVDEDGIAIEGKLRNKSRGTHIVATAAQLGAFIK